MTDSSAITALDALALSRAIHAREVSCRAVMTAYLDRIHRLNPVFNAVVAMAPEEALLAQADARDAELAQGRSRGWMHGFPQAIKDSADVVGFPSTLGCALLAGQMPQADQIIVERVKAAGCIVIGKTNIPEFGLGSHTFNDLYGTTRNAWDPAVTAGGSSGGAAVCLAQRMLPVADGSDFMGSLRNPAAWNHVFGMRPSQGLVPRWPRADLWLQQLGVDGPMGRTVRDLATLLQTQAGGDMRDPLAFPGRPADLVPPEGDAALPALRGCRIGWLGDLGGHLAVEAGILPLCEAALQRMADAGAVVEPATLAIDLEQLWRDWLVWRRALTAPGVAAVLALPGARDKLHAKALWEHDQAQGLSYAEFQRASVARSRFHARMVALTRQYDVLALPMVQSWPFPVAQAWPTQIAGRPMDTYHRWMECTLYATFAGLPAISVPAGFDAAGRWPMGLQLIGGPQGDAALLRIAAGYEALIGDLMQRRPPEPV